MQHHEPFIEVYSGKRFTPLAPVVADIDIWDIAHALSHQCRFSGHVRTFYCPPPEQRILTADLRWVPAGDLTLGTELLAFDEEPFELGQAGKRKRRFRHGRVTHTQPVRKQIVRLELEDGSTVRSSAEHPWLVATKQSRNQKWMTAEEIRVSLVVGQKRYMHKFIDPWADESSRRAGWLAGMADGEGCFSCKNRGGVQLNIAQKLGPVLDEICGSLKAFSFEGRGAEGGHGAGGDVAQVQLAGGWEEIARFLGAIRPMRLLDKFMSALRSGEFAMQMNGRVPLQIVHAYEEGEDWVSGLSTSTRTYLCEGYAAHNCVAEHSVRVANLLAEWGEDRETQLWGLLHDASEAYLVDVPMPLKDSEFGVEYKRAEERLMRAVCYRFGLPIKEPIAVRRADRVMLATEARDLMPHRPENWRELDVPPLATRISPWEPGMARHEFLKRFKELKA